MSILYKLFKTKQTKQNKKKQMKRKEYFGTYSRLATPDAKIRERHWKKNENYR